MNKKDLDGTIYQLHNVCTWVGCEEPGTNPRTYFDNNGLPVQYCDEHAFASDELMRSSIERGKLKDKFVTIRLSIEELLDEVIELENHVISECHRLEENECT